MSSGKVSKWQIIWKKFLKHGWQRSATLFLWLLSVKASNLSHLCPKTVFKCDCHERVTHQRSKGDFDCFSDRPVTVPRFPHQYHNFTILLYHSRHKKNINQHSLQMHCVMCWEAGLFHESIPAHLGFLCLKRVFRLFLLRLFCSVSFFICC